MKVFHFTSTNHPAYKTYQPIFQYIVNKQGYLLTQEFIIKVFQNVNHNDLSVSFCTASSFLRCSKNSAQIRAASSTVFIHGRFL